MSPESIRLMNAHTNLLRFPDHNINQTRTLTWSVCRCLNMDSCQREEAAAEEIGAYLEMLLYHLPNLQGE